MKLRPYLLLFLLIYLTPGAFAQQTQTLTGCVIYEHDTGNPIYWQPIFTESTGGTGICNGYYVTFYSGNTSALPLEQYCYVSSIPNARTFPGARGFFGYRDPNYRNCNVNGSCGVINTITVTTCPLDDHLWMMAALGLPMLGLWIRKRPDLLVGKTSKAR